MACNETYPCNDCNCNACGHCIEDCTCTLPDYDDTGCLETISSDCVTFAGDALPCIPIQKGNTITLVIQRIVTYLKNLWNNVTSESLVITPSAGSCNNTMTIEVVPSADDDNIFTLGTDGRPYVPASEDAVVEINMVDGNCITWEETNVDGVITLTPTVDWNCVASHVCPLCAGTLCPNPLNLTVN